MFRNLGLTPAPRKLGKYFVFFALWAGWACKLSAPAAFLDEIKGGVTLTNLRNVATGYAGELYSGVITGTLTDGGSAVKVAFDDGGYKSATVTGSAWRIFIPTGAEAAAGKQRWQAGSKHTMKVRTCNATGDCKAESISVSFIRQQNKDVNGDGYGDVIIGAYAANANLGKAYIFQSQGPAGVTSGVDTSAATILTGTATAGFFGSAVALADFNGDGYADALVAASGANANKGTAHIFISKGAAGISSVSDTAAQATITGTATSGFMGNSAAVADINGDGFADIIVTAINASSGLGKAYVYHSIGASGLISISDASANTVFSGTATSGQFGRSVTTGDCNGDGYADVIVGANNVSAGLGKAYIFHSQGSTGVATSSDTDAMTTITGTAVSGQLGWAVVTGDINGDGFADAVIGAKGANTSGRTYIFISQGSVGVASASDTAASTTLTGTLGTGAFGISLASGDVNGDGYADIAIGADQVSAALGKAFIFHSAGGSGVPAANDISAATILTGTAASGVFGSGLTLSDFTGDGNADLVVAASNVSSNLGKTYVFHSLGTAGINSVSDTAATRTLTGTAATGSFGIAVGFLAPTLRPAPASLDLPTPARPSFGNPWPELAIFSGREEEETYA